eukprot:g28824.t1
MERDFWELHRKLGEAYEADTRQRRAPGFAKFSSHTPPSLHHSQPGGLRFNRSGSNLGSTPFEKKVLVRADSARSAAFERLHSHGDGTRKHFRRSLAFGSVGLLAPPSEDHRKPCGQNHHHAGDTGETENQMELHLENFWDFLGIILLVADAIALPLLFVNASFFEDFPALTVVSEVEVGFWTMDVVLSFFTGYLHKGNLILNHKDIARHYLTLGPKTS